MRVISSLCSLLRISEAVRAMLAYSRQYFSEVFNRKTQYTNRNQNEKRFLICASIPSDSLQFPLEQINKFWVLVMVPKVPINKTDKHSNWWWIGGVISLGIDRSLHGTRGDYLDLKEALSGFIQRFDCSLKLYYIQLIYILLCQYTMTHYQTTKTYVYTYSLTSTVSGLHCNLIKFDDDYKR